MVLAILTGWLDRQERQAVAYLIEENRVLRGHLGQRRLQFTDAKPHPNDLFMGEVGRTLTETDGPLRDHRVLICDRDRK
jgi:hypothetical protein